MGHEAGRPATARSDGRRVRASVLTLALLLGAVALSTTDAGAAPGGTISGTVTAAPGGTPLAGIQVQVLGATWGNVVTSTTTAANGTYAITVASGTYKVRFRDPAGVRADRYNGHALTRTNAPAINLAANTTTTANAALPLGDRVDGTVTNASATPVPNLTVELVDDLGGVSDVTTTAADGTYLFDGVNARFHTVRFIDPADAYGQGYAGGARTASTATYVQGNGNQTFTLDHTAELAGALTGTANIGQTGPGAGNIVAAAFDASDGELLAYDVTDAAGAWTITGLAPGDTKVGIVDLDYFETGAALRPVAAPDVDLATVGVDDGLAAATNHPVTSSTTGIVPEVHLAGRDCDPTVYAPEASFGYGTSQAGKDLRGCDLDHAWFVFNDLTSTDLSYADLEEATFGHFSVEWGYNMAALDVDYSALSTTTGTKFRGANLRNAIIESPQFLAADRDWTGTDLTGTSDLRYPHAFGWWTEINCEPNAFLPCGGPRTDMGLVHLDGLDAAGAAPAYFLRGSVFEGTRFTDADLAGMDLAGWRCIGCVLTDADLSSADLATANIAGATINRADLSSTGITAAALAGANPNWRGTRLSGADLSGGSFVSYDMTGADLSGASLANTALTSAKLANATLTGTNLTGALVNGAAFTGAIGLTAAQVLSTQPNWGAVSAVVPAGTAFPFTGVDLSDVDLSARILDGASFRGLDLSGTRFPATSTWVNASEADLTAADFASTSTRFADFTDAVLVGADLSNAAVQWGNFTGADVTGADLTGATITRTTWFGATGLTKAMLQAANHDWTAVNVSGTGISFAGDDFTVGGYKILDVTWDGLDASGAKLSAKDLTGASLVGTDLSGANLAYANLTNVDLRNADLTGANLTGAIITNADLTGAVGLTANQIRATNHNWRSTKLAGTGLDLSGTQFALGGYTLLGADLSGVNLANAGLAGRDLTYIDLVGANLAGANLSFAKVQDATMDGANLAGANLTGANFWEATGTPVGGSTATYANTTCPDATKVSAPETCVGHGFAA